MIKFDFPTTPEITEKIVYSFSHNSGSGKPALNERKLILEGPIFHFHDYGRKGMFESHWIFFLRHTHTLRWSDIVPCSDCNFPWVSWLDVTFNFNDTSHNSHYVCQIMFQMKSDPIVTIQVSIPYVGTHTHIIQITIISWTRLW